MIDREKKYKEELDLCRKNIQRTKRLIEYHKNILRSLESKEKVLSDKLEKENISMFYKLLSKNGYDIDALKTAFENGELDEIFSDNSEAAVPAAEKNICNDPIAIRQIHTS